MTINVREDLCSQNARKLKKQYKAECPFIDKLCIRTVFKWDLTNNMAISASTIIKLIIMVPLSRGVLNGGVEHNRTCAVHSMKVCDDLIKEPVLLYQFKVFLCMSTDICDMDVDNFNNFSFQQEQLDEIQKAWQRRLSTSYY